MFRNILVLLFVSFSVLAQDDLYIIDSPDIAEPGEYWEPTGSGWGLTINLQKTNFSPSGYYLQGEVYTYKEDGTPIWYIFQGDYKPNQDVYAWREGRGSLATFESLIGVSQNGQCLDCNHTPNDISILDKGNIVLEWSDPISMTMTVNGVTKHLKNMFYHDGLNNNNADFITERLFYVHGVHSFRLNKNDNSLFKGIAKFTNLNENQISNISKLNPNFKINHNFSWYIMKDHGLEGISGFEDRGQNVFEDELTSYFDVFILLGYDTNTGLAFLYPGIIESSNGEYNYYVRSCLNRSLAVSFNGLLRPAKAQTSRFYYNANDVMSTCSNEGANTDWKRQQFIDLTALPYGFDDLSNVPFMFENPRYD